MNLKKYIEHNIKHLEDHIKTFTKLKNQIESNDALNSIDTAISHLQNGITELKTALSYIV